MNSSTLWSTQGLGAGGCSGERDQPQARLVEACAREKLQAGIIYVHEPTLGNPRDNRDGFREQQPDSIAAFEAHLERNGSAALDRVHAMLRDRTVGLLCFEADPCSCHRSIVARYLLDRDPLASVRPA